MGRSQGCDELFSLFNLCRVSYKAMIALKHRTERTKRSVWQSKHKVLEGSSSMLLNVLMTPLFSSAPLFLQFPLMR